MRVALCAVLATFTIVLVGCSEKANPPVTAKAEGGFNDFFLMAMKNANAIQTPCPDDIMKGVRNDGKTELNLCFEMAKRPTDSVDAIHNSLEKTAKEIGVTLGPLTWVMTDDETSLKCDNLQYSAATPTGKVLGAIIVNQKTETASEIIVLLNG